jgi:hypothetical protein
MSTTIEAIKNNKKESLIYCSLIFVGSLVFRLYYFPYDLPVVVDGLDYFFYATEISMLQNLPQNWIVINSGWPIFLSFWFSIIQLEETQQYMELQKVLTVVLSSATIVPVYLICKNFVDVKYAIIGAILFGIDPRIVLNSLLGSTDPLYILLGAISLVLLLKNDKKFIYLAFVFAAFCIIVRGEGIFFVLAITIIFFMKNKINFESVKIFIPSIIIFSVILIPILLQRIEISGSDGVFLRVSQAAIETSVAANTDKYQNIFSGIELFFKYLIWVLIPNFILFIPLTIIYFIKNRLKENKFIIIFLTIMSIPALYAYMVPAQDTRYLYFLFPMFTLLSVIIISKYLDKNKFKNYLIVLIIAGIIISSILFFEYKKDDWRMNNKIEIINMKVAEEIISTADGVNVHPTEARYIRALQIPNEWPYYYNEIKFKTQSIGWLDEQSIKDFIKQNERELTHIIVDDNDTLPKFLVDIYHNEEKFNFLILEKNYEQLGFNNKIKIFKIDYEQFNIMYDQEMRLKEN